MGSLTEVKPSASVQAPEGAAFTNVRTHQVIVTIPAGIKRRVAISF